MGINVQESKTEGRELGELKSLRGYLLLWNLDAPSSPRVKMAGLAGLSSATRMPGIAILGLGSTRRSIAITATLHPSTSTRTYTRQGVRHSAAMSIVGLGFSNLSPGDLPWEFGSVLICHL